jgi:hypothetical protein
MVSTFLESSVLNLENVDIVRNQNISHLVSDHIHCGDF